MKRLFTTLSLLSLVLLLTPPRSAQAALSNKAELSDKLTGRILLQVEDKGQAYYVDPVTKQRAYLGRPADAFQIMRELGLGISNANLAKIADPDENGADIKLAKSLAGRIVLQVEDKGQAYYINPADLKKYYLGKPADAFAVMRNQGLGITNDDLDKVPVFQKYKEKVEQLERKIEQIEGTGKVLGEGVKKQDEVITKQQKQIEELKKRVEKLSKQSEARQYSLPPTTDTPGAITNLPTLSPTTSTNNYAPKLIPTVVENWPELENKYFTEANQKGWPSLFIINSIGEKRYYRKEGTQWVRKNSESEATSKYVDPKAIESFNLLMNDLNKKLEETKKQQQAANDQKKKELECLMEPTPPELRTLSPQQQQYLREQKCGTATPSSDLNYKLHQQQQYQDCVTKNPTNYDLYCGYLKPIFY